MKPLSNLAPFFLSLVLTAGMAGCIKNSGAERPSAGIKEKPETKRPWDLLKAWLPEGSVPFSFICGDRPSSEILAEVPGRTGHYTALNGILQVTQETSEYRETGCVEGVVKVKNAGSADSPVLRDLLALDLNIPLLPHETQPEVYHSRGCGGGEAGGIEAFMIDHTTLRQGGQVQLSNPGGGKTVSWLPFFNLDLGGRGIIGAVGWTGCWTISIDRPAPDTIHLKAGMERVHTLLHPGEEIPTPVVLLMAWEGDRNEGHNRLRRHILSHHTPQYNGQPVPGLLCFTSWGGMKTANHLNMIATIRRAQLPYDCYWIDAGWFGPPHECEEYQNLLTEDWFFNVGDWRINTMVHPEGLKPVSDAVHAAGMKFLLWFEPERSISSSPLVAEHPGWFFHRKPTATVAGRTAEFCIFNFGIPEARQWMTDMISGYIRELGIDIFRHDGNFGLSKTWAAEDTPDRAGISEIRYVEGINEFWDELQRRFPHLILDLAQRRDLMTISRGIDLFRSDYTGSPYSDPTGGQVSLHGISHWMPLTGTGTPSRPADTYSLLSDFSPFLGLSFFPATNDKTVIPHIPENYPLDWHRKNMELHKKAEPFFRGDYYPLLPGSLSQEEWCAMQFHRADLDAGMVLFYRRPRSPYTSARFPLHGLTAENKYLVETHHGSHYIAGGNELAGTGLQVTAEMPRTAGIIFYKRVKKK